MAEASGWHTPFRSGRSIIGRCSNGCACRLKHCLGRCLHWRLACHVLLSYSGLWDLV
jgi:hypothetical protein